MENPMVKEINEKLLNDIVNNDFETCINQFIINSQQSTRILFQSNRTAETIYKE